MGRRGRPPYPDILTPREWEVLALLREGLSNEEVAEIRFGGDLYPVAWNPRGDRLAFGYNPGRGACEDAFAPGAPTPAPTTLEVLSD